MSVCYLNKKCLLVAVKFGMQPTTYTTTTNPHQLCRYVLQSIMKYTQQWRLNCTDNYHFCWFDCLFFSKDQNDSRIKSCWKFATSEKKSTICNLTNNTVATKYFVYPIFWHLMHQEWLEIRFLYTLKSNFSFSLFTYYSALLRSCASSSYPRV